MAATPPTNPAPCSDFAVTTPLRVPLEIPDDALDQAMGIAFQLYKGGRYAEAEIVCRGLLACDHLYWWPHSLLAAILRRIGRSAEALEAVERGLQFEPGQPKLLLMRAELTATLACRAARSRPATLGAALGPAAL